MVKKAKTKTPTKQGDYEVGNKKPPKNRQFGQPEGNPRNSGAWKKEDTPRYKLEQMMKLPKAELKAVAEDESRPYFERRLAVCINKGDWKTFESMINQVYGQPKQPIDADVTSGGQSLAPVALVEFKNGTGKTKSKG